MNLPEAVTLANARALRDSGVAVCKTLSRGATWVVDAAALQRFDSSLLTTLLEWQRTAKAQGVALALKGLSSPVAKRLKSLAASYGVSELIQSVELQTA